MAYNSSLWPIDPAAALPLDDAFSPLTLGMTTETGNSSFAGLLTQGLLPSGAASSSLLGSSAGLLLPTAPAADHYSVLDFDGSGGFPGGPGSSSILGSAPLSSPPSSTSSLLGSVSPYRAADGSPASFAGPFFKFVPTGQATDDQVVLASYTGSDLRVMLELTAGGASKVKQLIELTTISISIFRVKSPARACGYINPKAFARGSRTIAGTLVLNQFTRDLMYYFLTEEAIKNDLSKDTISVKPDQLPPFNLTMLFGDEFGNQSHRRLLGVEVLNDGAVYSQQNMFTEQTLSYMASDFTPLLPDKVGNNYTPAAGSAAAPQRTPMQVLVR